MREGRGMETFHFLGGLFQVHLEAKHSTSSVVKVTVIVVGVRKRKRGKGGKEKKERKKTWSKRRLSPSLKRKKSVSAMGLHKITDNILCK